VRAAPSPRAEDAPAVCRYCGEVAAAADAFCGRCGMRLQRVRPGPSR
jgi:predicted amidophosphoribosyltransferase